MNQEQMIERLELQQKIWHLHQQHNQVQNSIREFLIWQVGGQILLGANFAFGNTLAYWIRVAAFLIFLLALTLLAFSSHNHKGRQPLCLEQLMQLELQVLLQDIADFQQQIRYWQIRKSWVHNLAWLGLWLHIIGLVIEIFG